jgi:hypothetical protein
MPSPSPVSESKGVKKNRHAVALGRLGGKKTKGLTGIRKGLAVTGKAKEVGALGLAARWAKFERTPEQQAMYEYRKLKREAKAAREAAAAVEEGK